LGQEEAGDEAHTRQQKRFAHSRREWRGPAASL
jgi:hypothetical protein